MQTLVGVVGASAAPQCVLDAAFETGIEIVKAGYSLICGGLGGVMEAACRGAHSVVGDHSGRIIGVLPGHDKYDANPYVDVVIATGMGYARNSIIACTADALIAVSGGSGTLSEIALAWQYGKPIIVLRDLPGFVEQLIDQALDSRRNDRVLGAQSPGEALALVRSMLEP